VLVLHTASKPTTPPPHQWRQPNVQNSNFSKHACRPFYPAARKPQRCGAPPSATAPGYRNPVGRMDGITVCDAPPRLVCGRSNKIHRGVAARGSNGHSLRIKEMIQVDDTGPPTWTRGLSPNLANVARACTHKRLMSAFEGKADSAEWVKGVGSEAEVGILAQQVLGRLFRNDFAATRRVGLQHWFL